MKKLEQHKTMPSNHVFDMDQVTFFVGIQVRIRESLA